MPYKWVNMYSTWKGQTGKGISKPELLTRRLLEKTLSACPLQGPSCCVHGLHRWDRQGTRGWQIYSLSIQNTRLSLGVGRQWNVSSVITERWLHSTMGGEERDGRCRPSRPLPEEDIVARLEAWSSLFFFPGCSQPPAPWGMVERIVVATASCEVAEAATGEPQMRTETTGRGRGHGSQPAPRNVLNRWIWVGGRTRRWKGCCGTSEIRGGVEECAGCSWTGCACHGIGGERDRVRKRFLGSQVGARVVALDEESEVKEFTSDFLSSRDFNNTFLLLQNLT